jgi:hypothetical protein
LGIVERSQLGDRRDLGDRREFWPFCVRIPFKAVGGATVLLDVFRQFLQVKFTISHIAPR